MIDQHDGGTDEGASGSAGVFGTLGGAAVIENLKLDNTAVSAAGASAAGALVGRSDSSLTVTNVQSFLEEPKSGGSAIQAQDYAGGLIGCAAGNLDMEYCASYSKTGSPGTVEATGANGIAGGLVGAVLTGSDEESTITGCAAANLVRASTAAGSGSIAGGLIGQAAGETNVIRSYVGGVTQDGGLYDHKREAGTNDTLNGNVQGAHAGGFIGQAVDGEGVTLDRVYSTASAYGTIEAGNLYPPSCEGRVDLDPKYGTIPFHSYGAGETQSGSGDIQTGTIPDYHSPLTTDAEPYDDLPSKYPYDCLWDMSTEDEKKNESNYEWLGKYEGGKWTGMHVGDWPGTPLHPGITLHNEEILYAEVLLDDDCDYSEVILTLKGADGGSAVIPFPAYDSETHTFAPDSRVYPKLDEDGNPVHENGKIVYIVVLDDVTVPGLDFGSIPGSTIPLGSDITATVTAASQDGRRGEATDDTGCNSLFADGTSMNGSTDPANPVPPNTVQIDNFRHLQNLDKLNPEETPPEGGEALPTVHVVLDSNLTWTSPDDSKQPFKENVEDFHSACGISGGNPSYTPIHAEYPLDFDGSGHSISNLVIDSTDNPEGNGNAGVFGTLEGGASITNLNLDNVTVNQPETSEALNAGALVGSSSGGLTVENVNSSAASVTAKDHAGGLIGYASGVVTVTHCTSYVDPTVSGGTPGTVTATGESGTAGGLIGAVAGDSTTPSTITGCAASNLVTAGGSDSENSAAGGLIGEVSGKVEVSRSYVGGHTENGGEYNHQRVEGTSNTLDGNVQGACAGGFIGKVSGEEGTAVTLDRVYSTASAYGTVEAGSLYPASSAGNVKEDPNYSAALPYHSYGAGETQSGDGPIVLGSGAYAASPDTDSQPYDAGLTDQQFPFLNLWDMSSEEEKQNTADSAWMAQHIGDWPASPIHPELELHNGAVLYAEVKLDADYAYSQVTLNLTGLDADGSENGSASISFPFNPATGAFDASGSTRVFPKLDKDGKPVQEDGKLVYIVVLDDVTADGLGFGDIPGNTIPTGSTIKAVVTAKTVDNVPGVSNEDRCGSLFGDDSQVQAGDGSADKAAIENFRHLQNLSRLNPAEGETGDSVTAELKHDIDWNAFTEAVQHIHALYTKDYSQASDSVAYTPVNLENHLDFDGGGHSIKNLTVSQTDGNGNAGVFGTLGGGASIAQVNVDNAVVNASGASAAGALVGSGSGGLTISDVHSSASSVTAKDYAGGLVGYAAGTVSVTASASYSAAFAESGADGTPGSVTATGKNGAAGGLIGAIASSGGTSTVGGCAAANLVEAEGTGGIAGGLIGQASGKVDVSLSYTGGVNAGGANIQGDTAGGLVGQANGGNVTLTHVYSTASVQGKNTDPLCNGAAADSGSYGADSSMPVSEDPVTAKPYDKDLLDGEGSTEYPYKSIQDMMAEMTASGESLPAWYDPANPPEWLENHIGDWSNGELHPELKLNNGAVLYAEVKLDADYAYSQVTLNLTGLDAAGNENGSASISFPFNPATGAFDASGSTRVFPKLDKDGKPVQEDGKIVYIVVLDDVTADGLGFGDIPGNTIPAGSTIKGVVSAKSTDKRQGDSNEDRCGSLFGDSSQVQAGDGSADKAAIENFRHLQNLSRLSPAEGETGDSVTAELKHDIDWNAFTEAVQHIHALYTKDYSQASESVAYTPVNLENHLDFDGGGHSIKNLTVSQTDGNGNAGVFGTLGGGASIAQVNVDNAVVNASGASAAGALVGSGSGGLTISDVHSSAASVTAKDYAGGLVGYAAGQVSVMASASYSAAFAESGADGTPGSVTATGKNGAAGGLIGAIASSGGTSTVEGCAAANIVKAKGGDGIAGGLIGQASGKAAVSLSYTGGVSTDSDSASIQGDTAGGRIGQADGGSVTLSHVYSAASVQGKDSAEALCNGASATGGSYGASDSMPLSDSPVTAMPYDKDLLDGEGSTEYPYKSIQDMAAAMTSGGESLPAWYDADDLPEWLENHIGDWPDRVSNDRFSAVLWGTGGTAAQAMPDGRTLQTIRNDNVRCAWVELREDISADPLTVILSVSNVTAAGEDTRYKYTVKADGTVTPAEDKAPAAVYQAEGPDGTTATDGSGNAIHWLRVTLDDITTQGQRFHDLFPSLDPALEIRLRAAKNNKALSDSSAPTRWTGTNADDPKPNTGYVLYDLVSGGEKAVVSNIRHLQNLDPSVSHVGSTVTAAVLVRDLDWTEGGFWNTKTIYLDAGGSVCKANSFYGIGSTYLTEFDGQNHTLRNFVIDRSVSGETAPDSGAGLFRKLNGSAHNLKLDTFTVKAGSGGSAGVLAAETAGSSRIDTVLAVRADQGVPTVSGTNAGGLVGKAAGTELTVYNSAATVIASGTAASGGLVGTSSAALTIENSYAGGHTVGGRYVTGSSENYNIRGAKAGGLAGELSGGSLTAKQSFSAASVSSTDGTSGGGLLGSIASGVTTNLSFVYVIAPVGGVEAVSADTPEASYGTGAVTGVSVQRIANTNTFYLPEVYSGYTAANNYKVRTSGTVNAFSNPLQLAYYDRSDISNIIAARSHEDTMEIKTYPYDRTGLTTSGSESGPYREYPFSIWTTFTFEEGLSDRIGGNSEKTYGVYYGDWQPILPDPTVTHTLRLYYADAEDGGAVKPIEGDANLTVQAVQEGKDNRILLPYVAPIPGWQIRGWYLTDANGQPLKVNGQEVSFPEDDGYITIPAEYCSSNQYITALIERNPSEYAVTFVYDATGQNRYSGAGADYARIGRVLAIQKGQDNTVTVPSRLVDGYLFQGWYTNAGLTAEAFPVSADYKMTIPASASTKDYTFYAKYQKPEYEFATIDFMYETADGKLEAISSVPVFQVEDAAQYQIQFLKGQGYSGWVKLPSNLTAFTPLRLLDAEKLLDDDGQVVKEGASVIAAAGSASRFRNSASEVYIDTGADHTRHYIMLYQYGGASANVIRYTVKFELAQSKASGIGYVFDQTGTYTYAPSMATLDYPESVIPQPSLDNAAFQVVGFRPKSYSHRVTGSNTGEITVKFVRQTYTLSFDTGNGTYIPSKTVAYGEPLSNHQPTTNPTQAGYSFDGWEKIYKTGDDSQVLSGAWSGTMPAYNVQARAKWIAATVNYTVLFWYENANDDSHSYMGSVSRTAATGSSVTSSSFSGYPGMSASTGVSAIYPGTGTAFTKSGSSWKYGSYTATITNSSGAGDGDVRQFSYKKNNRTYTAKCIYYNGTWYLYEGSTAAGSTAPAQGTGESYPWIDTSHYTFDSSRVETETVKADGTTILNVYFKRNTYTFTFKNSNTVIHSFSAKYQEDISGKWTFTGSNGVSYPRSDVTTSWTPSGSSIYTTRITRMEIMPDENITFSHTTTSNSSRHFIYYVESLGSGVETFESKKFDVYLDYNVDFNYAYYNDEFFLLNGFERYAATQNGSKLSWKAGGNVKLGSSDTMRFYYTRNSYSLSYSVAGSTVNTASVKYEAPLNSYLNYTPTRPASVGADYVFDGWYKDPECTQSVDAEKMPYSNLIVFGKWNPPDHTVTFTVTEGGTMSAAQTAFTVKHGGTVPGIANSAGDWLDSYKPTLAGHTFAGWFYTVNGVEQRFIPNQTILTDIYLTSKWEADAAALSASVTIRYVREADNTPFLDGDGNPVTDTLENQHVNSICTAQAAYFEGYYPVNTLRSIMVLDDDSGNNVITFTYRKIHAWTYSVEYYAYYRSYESSGLDFKAALGTGFTGFRAGPDAWYISTGTGQASSQYESVLLSLPDAFKERYHFHHYEYESATGYDARATIHPDASETAVVKVYLEPDPSLLAVSDRTELYSGSPLSAVSGLNTLSQFTGGGKTVTAKLMNVYRYFSADGTPQSQVVDSDAYGMHGYTVLQVDSTEGGNTTTRYYLLYKDESDGLNLRIRRRAVTLTSASGSKPYDGEPLKNDVITVTGDGFAPGEGYDYAFSVEAFRLDQGTSDNSFNYSLKNGTKAANYDITVVFGSLTVT